MLIWYFSSFRHLKISLWRNKLASFHMWIPALLLDKSRLLKFPSLGKSECSFNFCWRMNKSVWDLASYSHCRHISFRIYISTNLKICKVSTSCVGKIALDIQTPEVDWTWSLEAACYSNSAIWWTQPPAGIRSGMQERLMTKRMGTEHMLFCRLYSLSDLKHVFCVDLHFFQWQWFRLELCKRTKWG